jgi:hypothetical protein
MTGREGAGLLVEFDSGGEPPHSIGPAAPARLYSRRVLIEAKGLYVIWRAAGAECACQGA